MQFTDEEAVGLRESVLTIRFYETSSYDVTMVYSNSKWPLTA